MQVISLLKPLRHCQSSCILAIPKFSILDDYQNAKHLFKNKHPLISMKMHLQCNVSTMDRTMDPQRTLSVKADKRRGRQTSRQTDRQTSRQAGRSADRQTGRGVINHLDWLAGVRRTPCLGDICCLFLFFHTFLSVFSSTNKTADEAHGDISGRQVM